MAIDFNQLLEKYKSIYFDADYYLKGKAAAYNANHQDGRTDWTASNLGVTDAWADFRDDGWRYQNADGTTGINPSRFFDLNRYYQDKGGLTTVDAISDYTSFVVSQYNLSDPAQATQAVTPTRVDLGGEETLYTPDYWRDVYYGYSRTISSSDLPYAQDGFTSSLQYNGLNWNYLGRMQDSNVLYYSFDADLSWAESDGVRLTDRSYVTTCDTLDQRYYDDCHTAFTILSSITGITFEYTTDIDKSNMHIFAGTGPGWDGVTIHNTGWGWNTAILIQEYDDANYDFSTFATIAHEIGHAVGLKHPFDENTWEEAFGNDEYNDYDYSLMSYSDGLGAHRWQEGYSIYSMPYAAVYGPRDILALQYLYGTDGLNGSEGLVYADSLSANPVAIRDAGAVTADEIQFANGSVTATGVLKLANPEDLESVTIGGVAVLVNGGAFRTDVRGNNVKVNHWVGNQLVGVLTFTDFDRASGELSYTYTLNQAVRHAPGADRLTDSLEVEVVGRNGGGTGAIGITITDDGPVAANDTAKITVGAASTVVTGNVLDNDEFGADEAAPESRLLWDLTESAQYGEIEIARGDDEGSFTYRLDENNARVKALAQGETLDEVFHYTIRDSDGDESSATLTITIEGAGGGAGPGDDSLLGTAENDNIDGLGGNDAISGLGGDDTLYGGMGDDTLYGGSGKDSLNGGSGKDSLSGGAGDDSLSGSSGDDTLHGGADNDLLHGGAGHDTVYGDTGNDTVYGDTGNDKVVGGAGDDTLHGGGGNDTLHGGEGKDSLNGGAGRDSLNGGAGNDSLNGGAGNDILHGSEGDDTLHGGADNDTVYGDTGNDTVYGDTGNDKVVGGAGDDKLVGGADNDALHGGDDNDALYGDAGNDRLYGDAGDDKLVGGLGDDTLTGGEGKDVFVFNSALNASPNVDFITDFNRGDGDKIQLNRSIFAKLDSAGALKAENFAANATGAALDKDDFVIYNTKTGELLYDADGSGSGKAVQFAKLAVLKNGPQDLSENDFTVA